MHRTRTPEEYDSLKSSGEFRDLLVSGNEVAEKVEVHLSRAFDGHLDLRAN